MGLGGAGLPAAGGWGGSNRTLGITMEGFTEEDIAKAVDHCDNDRIKSNRPARARLTWQRRVSLAGVKERMLGEHRGLAAQISLQGRTGGQHRGRWERSIDTLIR